MLLINKDNFEKEVEGSDRAVLIDLYADWCGPCSMMKPILEELERENPNVKFCQINIDKDVDLAKMFKVKNIPMIAIVKDNIFVDFSEGYVDKENLQKFIDASIK